MFQFQSLVSLLNGKQKHLTFKCFLMISLKSYQDKHELNSTVYMDFINEGYNSSLPSFSEILQNYTGKLLVKIY